ncbi:MAG: DNA-protecting protein DprA [Candidatus Marinimicrobia bacterium]|nr:DNA-protecting protein DprA [Candidatus Neomarinimicrobiota bacterium]
MNKKLFNIIRMLSIPGVGPRKTLDLISEFGSLEDIFSVGYKELTRIPGIKDKIARSILGDPDEDLIAGQAKLIAKFQVEMVTLWDESYPDQLKQIYDPPIALFCRGNIELLASDSLGIVGTRTPSGYGKEISKEFSRDLAQRGLTVVSGAARGVDTYAHEACLKAGGQTIAVLGNGVDRVYPAENRAIYDELSEKGLLISEFLMGSKPDAQNFPRRNRIISGLTMGIIVVEAAERSGSLITAYFALDQNREVFSVPGPVNSRQSRGTNQLIKQGAKLVESIEDILEELGGKYKMGSSQGQQELLIATDPLETAVLEHLPETEEIHIDDLSIVAGQTTFALLGTLLQLEMKGLIQQLPGKYFKRRF